MNTDSRIYICGINGMVGNAIGRVLQGRGYSCVMGHDRTEINYTNQAKVEALFSFYKPEYVVLAAAKVGGIMANKTYPGEFIYDNLQVQCNVIEACRQYGVKKLLFLGSSCIYPRNCPQPMREEHFMTGQLEETNDAYAMAKIAGIKMCDAYRRQYGMDFVTCMPTNLYGEGDKYHLSDSHVIPGLLMKFNMAKIKGDKTVSVWGTGNARREFLYVTDLAEACVILLERGTELMYNIGYGTDVTIRELAYKVASAVGYYGKIEFDDSQPEGVPVKLLDSSRIVSLGWKPVIDLDTGLRMAYADYCERYGAE